MRVSVPLTPTPEMSQAPLAVSSFRKGGAYLIFPQMWLKEVRRKGRGSLGSPL